MKKLTSLFLALILAMSMGTMAFAEEPVTISFQTWNPGDDVYIHEIIESFEAEHPNIKVEYIYMPYSDHIADMQIKMNNGEGPDVYGMQTGATYNEFRQYEVDALCRGELGRRLAEQIPGLLHGTAGNGRPVFWHAFGSDLCRICLGGRRKIEQLWPERAHQL